MRKKDGNKQRKVGKGEMQAQERRWNQNHKVKESMRFREYQGEDGR